MTPEQRMYLALQLTYKGMLEGDEGDYEGSRYHRILTTALSENVRHRVYGMDKHKTWAQEMELAYNLEFTAKKLTRPE